jgi:hypothetical protein
MSVSYPADREEGSLMPSRDVEINLVGQRVEGPGHPQSCGRMPP